jgi:polysaccharide biosynthesis protein PslG
VFPRSRSPIAVISVCLTIIGCTVVGAAPAFAATRNCTPTDFKGRIGASQGGSLMSLNDQDLDRTLTAARTAGVWALRVDVDWSVIERTRGKQDWANTDRVISAIIAHGICPHALVTYTPLWAADPADQPNSPYFRPKDPNLFAAFARTAATRYRNRIFLWEIWNEPNIVNFYRPKPDVVAYAKLLAASYTAIKSVNPAVGVISGGFAPAVDNGSDIAPITFLRQMYQVGANRYLDAVGMHPYCYPALPNDPSTSSWNAAQQMWPMHDIMNAAGEGWKTIWMTEAGAPTGTAPVAVTEQVQAQTFQILMQAANDVQWLGPAYVYSIRDAGTNPADIEQNFGIVRYDYTPKAAYAVVRQFGSIRP